MLTELRGHPNALIEAHARYQAIKGTPDAEPFKLAAQQLTKPDPATMSHEDLKYYVTSLHKRLTKLVNTNEVQFYFFEPHGMHNSV
jgi:hypothetical protein